MFCGVFDGHGPWGHLVSKRVKKVMPAFLLHYWQEASAQCSAGLKNANLNQFGMWKKSFKRACSTVDTDLELHPVIDSFYSGTAALTIIREVHTKLIITHFFLIFKESERIHKSGGSVCEADDEPGVSRIRAPHEESPDGPGLALSRAFGDFFVKDFGLISEPDVIQRTVTTRDRFVILATDGAVEIVSSATERDEAAKRIVDYAAGQWKLKRPGYAVDDISVVCLFFHNPVADPEILSSGHT
ncbi:hypothetical protein Ccrd_006279 [Cynara cardunculus var. scolymus]|uniref:PPM-type phosphatase domain-containing protein n=1 Tax=Cynara cardunculus var. scolymus TaxID=59895 RepID=A0A103XJE3_CYNCS|nr:hypothetical protein Ccrd_006279 [Cynara cardunculus var. scolymus]